MLVRSDRRYRVTAGPAAVWGALTDVDAYRHWWPWVSELDAEAFEAGARWRCTVCPPLPYVVRFGLVLDRVEAPSLVAATIDGDIDGHAEVTVRGLDGAGSEVRLLADLAPASPLLRLAARVAMPVLRLGHDWVLDRGAERFRAHLDGGTADPG